MYFDDVSRYETGWSPEGTIFKSIAIPVAQHENEAKAAKEKLDAIRKFNGYDAELAASLSTDEVRGEVTEWAYRSGLVGTEIGDEVYESVKSIYVCNSTSVLECIADFWSAVVSVIEGEKSHFTGIWNADSAAGSRLVLVIFPNCPELYEYKVMSTMHTAIDFCSEVCLHFGSKFTLTHFHPKFKNAPSMIHPTRHSPFPCFGLHFPGDYDDYVHRLSLKYGSDPIKKKIADAATPPERDWIKQRAATFEVLYNKAAASSTNDDLGRSAALRNISQRFPKEEVVEMTRKWIEQARYKALPAASTTSGNTSKGEINKALEFADTLHPDSWNVLYEKTPEEVYAAIWKIVSKMEKLGSVEVAEMRKKQVGVSKCL